MGCMQPVTDSSRESPSISNDSKWIRWPCGVVSLPRIICWPDRVDREVMADGRGPKSAAITVRCPPWHRIDRHLQPCVWHQRKHLMLINWCPCRAKYDNQQPVIASPGCGSDNLHANQQSGITAKINTKYRKDIRQQHGVNRARKHHPTPSPSHQPGGNNSNHMMPKTRDGRVFTLMRMSSCHI